MTEIHGGPSPEEVFALIHHRPGAVWLDSGPDDWSILAFEPVEVIDEGADALARARSRLGHAPESPVPFQHGWIGMLGYGFGHRVAPVPPETSPESEVWLGRYSGAMCWRSGKWVLTGPESLHDEFRALLEEARPLREAPPPLTRPSTSSLDRAAWTEAVRQILSLLEAGDCYQVNLTRAVTVEDCEPWETTRRLRRSCPAPYGATLRIQPDVLVFSASPELFLATDGRSVWSEPIKGTRPRRPDPVQDRDEARDLLRSAKDQAELTMIVDLVRNDLGRVATTGSVETDDRVLHAHPNVWHASQRVRAVLATGEDVFSALAATFPPGSVTGAPKVRACTRIAELEPVPRGPYCGAIGYICASGRSRFSVAIRTGVFHGTTGRYHVGCGIVAASDPEAEWEESVHKGSAMGSALTTTPERSPNTMGSSSV